MSMTPPANQPPAPAAPAAPAPSEPAAQPNPPVPTPPPAAPNAPQPPADPAQQQQQQDENPLQPEASPWNDPDKAKAEIERLRRENGDARINAKKSAADEARKELLETLTAALDPEAAKAGQPSTPEQLVAQLQTSTQERDQALADKSSAAKELAIVKEAWKLGVDPAKLEYLSFTLSRRADFSTKSPSDEDFGATLSSVISEELTKDSSLKSSGANIATGAPQFGGAGSAGAISKAEFEAMPYGKRLELYQTNPSEYQRLANS